MIFCSEPSQSLYRYIFPTDRHVCKSKALPSWSQCAYVNLNTAYERLILDIFGADEFVIAATPKLWVIELHNGVHNVLALTFINDAIRPALDTVEEEWRKSLKTAKAKGKSAAPDEGKGALIIIGKRDQNKFFSNGKDNLSLASVPR